MSALPPHVEADLPGSFATSALFVSLVAQAAQQVDANRLDPGRRTCRCGGDRERRGAWIDARAHVSQLLSCTSMLGGALQATTAGALGLALSAACKSVDAASALAPALTIVLILFGGQPLQLRGVFAWSLWFARTYVCTLCPLAAFSESFVSTPSQSSIPFYVSSVLCRFLCQQVKRALLKGCLVLHLSHFGMFVVVSKPGACCGATHQRAI